MKQFLIGKESGTPCVIFYDIKDFTSLDRGDAEIISFTEDGIDYSYIKEDPDPVYKEITDAAPEFDEYELTTDAAKAKKISDSFSQPKSASSKASTTNANKGNKGFIIKLKSGKLIDLFDQNALNNLTPAEIKEIEKEIQKLTGQTTNINPILGGSSSSSSSSSSSRSSSGGYSSGCGGRSSHC